MFKSIAKSVGAATRFPVIRLLMASVVALVGIAALSFSFNASAQVYRAGTLTPANQQRDVRLARVIQVNPVTVEGRGGNTGTLIGAMLGGLAGRQVGHGLGRDVATGIGALLGGHAGTRVQRGAGRVVAYEVFLQDLSNHSRRVTSTIQPDLGLRSGDVVFVSGYGRDVSLSLASPEAVAMMGHRAN